MSPHERTVHRAEVAQPRPATGTLEIMKVTPLTRIIALLLAGLLILGAGAGALVSLFG